jgi:predicted nuclease of predicted toxin-antitoxin system
VTAFLLDANLSPKIARFLASEFGFDVLSLQHMGLGDILDHDVLRRASAMRRVVITLDSDFARLPGVAGKNSTGIIYLRLPNSLRYVPEIKVILGAFFRTHASSIDLEHSLVIITEHDVSITSLDVSWNPESGA